MAEKLFDNNYVDFDIAWDDITPSAIAEEEGDRCMDL